MEGHRVKTRVEEAFPDMEEGEFSCYQTSRQQEESGKDKIIVPTVGEV